MLLITIEEADRAHLEEIALASLVECSERLKGLAAERNPDTYPRERARVTSAARLYLESLRPMNEPEADFLLSARAEMYTEAFARARARDSSAADGPAVDHVDGLPHTQQEQRAMLDAGLLPIKELGPHDPRARSPSCVHGRKFTGGCVQCLLPEAGGVDANGSPVT
jgi:hypothetical protein